MLIPCKCFICYHWISHIAIEVIDELSGILTKKAFELISRQASFLQIAKWLWDQMKRCDFKSDSLFRIPPFRQFWQSSDSLERTGLIPERHRNELYQGINLFPLRNRVNFFLASWAKHLRIITFAKELLPSVTNLWFFLNDLNLFFKLHSWRCQILGLKWIALVHRSEKQTWNWKMKFNLSKYYH